MTACPAITKRSGMPRLRHPARIISESHEKQQTEYQQKIIAVFTAAVAVVRDQKKQPEQQQIVKLQIPQSAE